MLASLLSSVSALSMASRRRTAQNAATRARALADHAAMAKALRTRDAGAADSLMVAHLQHVLETLKTA